MGPRREVIAATIDIGTNTVLLLVAELPPHPSLSPTTGERVKILRDEARITRLGEGIHRDPKFLPKAQERTLAALKEYRKIADSLGAKKITTVGTAAFRKSNNAPEFIARVKNETGIQIKIISGEEEARFSYLSVQKDFGDVTALDIGGGSTEIITKGHSVSLNLGAVVLTERHLKSDPPSETEVQSLTREIKKVLTDSPIHRFTDPPALIALAGTVTTLSAIRQKLVVWDGAKVQGSILTMEDVDTMILLFRKMTNQEKATIPGMVKGREDTILAGTLILRTVMKALGLTTVIVSDRGLRYGLLYEAFPAK